MVTGDVLTSRAHPGGLRLCWRQQDLSIARLARFRTLSGLLLPAPSRVTAVSSAKVGAIDKGHADAVNLFST